MEYLRLAFIILIQYAFEHNKNIINNIDKIEYLNNIFNDKEPSIQPGDSKPILANSLSIELKEVFS